MTKKELVKKISKDAGLNIKKARIVLTSVLSNIVKGTTEGDEQITLLGFGTFEKVVRKPRTCRNPQTGEKMEIGARAGVRFKAGAHFKHALAGKD